MLNVIPKEDYVEPLRKIGFKPEYLTGQNRFSPKVTSGLSSFINAATRRKNIFFINLGKTPALLLRNKTKPPSLINLSLLTTESDLKKTDSRVIKKSLFQSRFSIFIGTSRYRLLNFFPIVSLHQKAH